MAFATGIATSEPDNISPCNRRANSATAAGPSYSSPCTPALTTARGLSEAPRTRNASTPPGSVAQVALAGGRLSSSVIQPDLLAATQRPQRGHHDLFCGQGIFHRSQDRRAFFDRPQEVLELQLQAPGVFRRPDNHRVELPQAILRQQR